MQSSIDNTHSSYMPSAGSKKRQHPSGSPLQFMLNNTEADQLFGNLNFDMSLFDKFINTESTPKSSPKLSVAHPQEADSPSLKKAKTMDGVPVSTSPTMNDNQLAFNSFMHQLGQQQQSKYPTLYPSPQMQFSFSPNQMLMQTSPMFNGLQLSPSPTLVGLQPSGSPPMFQIMNSSPNNQFLPTLMPMAPSAFFPQNVNGHQQIYRPRKGLTAIEMEALFLSSNSHPSATRCKRDIAILCLILDLHLSSGTIIKMEFGNAPSISELVRQRLANPDQDPSTVSYQGHVVKVKNPGFTNPSTLTCHPMTAWALSNWMYELVMLYKWDMSDDTLHIFVNSQPVADPVTGERVLKQVPLKRDAISKVFQSIKQKCGVQCHKNNVASASLSAVGPVYLEWMKRLQLDWANKEV